MRLNFRDADFDALTAVWNAFYPPEFRIDAQVLRQHTVESPVFDWGASCIEVMDDTVLGFVAVKRSAVGLYKGQQQDVAHLSAIAYAQSDAGIDLMAEVKSVLRNRGLQKLNFGNDSLHFFPGCPSTAQALCGFLMVEGFEGGGECYDLERNLADYVPPRPIPTTHDFRPVAESDMPALTAFFEKEFPDRWWYDVQSKIRAEGRTEFITGAFKGDICEGFAMTQDWTCKLPISGGVWRNSLGEQWGALGAIGVSAELRGKGLGHGLMGAALTGLRDKGVRRCIIDWTIWVDFYGMHGFEVTRTYQAKSLRLGD